jgi:predicted house-cleaning noncanonical NTP pyrophosphatase (MazG superfamily)
MIGKLVRDKIPQIMKNKSQEFSVRKLDEKEYILELLKKLTEEVEEFQQDQNMEELADIYEVLEAIQTTFNFEHENIMKIKKKKFEERGGFTNKIFLTK